MLSFLECITCSSSLFLGEIKLTAVFNWIFHESDSLRPFIISFKYGLILKYFSTHSILLLSPLLSFPI